MSLHAYLKVVAPPPPAAGSVSTPTAENELETLKSQCDQQLVLDRSHRGSRQ